MSYLSFLFQLMELDPLPNPIHRSILYREQSEHRSESIYFTPTGTPVREVYGSWGTGVQSNSLKNTPAKEFDAYKAVYAAAPPGLGRRPIPPGVGHRRNKSWSQFLPPFPSWLSPTGRSGDASRINEVEVVIEHDGNGDDYFIDVEVDSSPTASKVSDSAAVDSLSKSTTGVSIRRSVSVPGDETSAKHSLTSSSGIVSMGSSSSPQQRQLQQTAAEATRSAEEVPLLPQRSSLAQSVTCLLPDSEPSHQKRLSI